MAMPTWISEAGVGVTTFVAFLAVFGDRLRAAVLKPRLRLALRNTSGELIRQDIRDQTGAVVQVLNARYFHLRATNAVRFPAAHEVEVFLTKLEIRGPNGEPQILYETDIPLSWMHPQLHPNRLRTIGSTTVALSDLFYVRDGELRLLPLLSPNNFPDTFQPDAHFWVTVVARGYDGESNHLRLKIDWNGQWHLGQTEMGHHLTIAVAPD